MGRCPPRHVERRRVRTQPGYKLRLRNLWPRLHRIHIHFDLRLARFRCRRPEGGRVRVDRLPTFNRKTLPRLGQINRCRNLANLAAHSTPIAQRGTIRARLSGANRHGAAIHYHIIRIRLGHRHSRSAPEPKDVGVSKSQAINRYWPSKYFKIWACPPTSPT